MLKNYFKIAVRSLFRNGLFTFINIFGLALSMSIGLLVLMRLKDRMNYDRFHPHSERTYRIITQATNKQGNTVEFASSPLPLATTLSANYNLADGIARLYAPGKKTVIAAKKTLSINTAFTEPAFFTLFGFALKQGDAGTALQEPNSIVLSRETALKFFGRDNVIGQTIQFESWGNFLITGVLSDAKGKSHIDFDAYTSMSSIPVLEKTGKLPALLDQWNNLTGCYTYIQVKKGITEHQLNQAIGQVAGNLMKTVKRTGRENLSFETQPLQKIILGKELMNNLGDTGSRGKTWSEVIIAFIILLMACFNYTNLSIARSLKRGKEIGIRKVAGAIRHQVFMQFIIESLFTALLSLGLAYVILQLIMDYAPFASEMIPPGAAIDLHLFGWFLLFSLFAGLLAGVIPAWALSAFKPVDVLKNLTTIRLFGGDRFRKALTVTQFSISLMIVIFTSIFSRQFHYMATADPGFRRDNVLNISLNGSGYYVLNNAITRVHGVEQVSASSDLPGRFDNDHCLVKPEPGSEPIQMDYMDTDAGFIGTMGLRLLAGSTFPTSGTDIREQYVVVNEKALQVLKVRAPADAIGRLLWINDTAQVQIIGVIKDFYSRGLDMPLSPLLLRNRSTQFNYLNVHAATTQHKELIAAIEKTWKTNNPDQPLQYSWLKEELYEQKSGWGTVSMLGFLAIIAITIACLGLLGMVMYTTETRRKEIGIRKVMGAGVYTIMLLLSKGYLKLVVIAGAIALPVSYMAGWLFLNIFANRISIGAGMLAGSFMGLLLLVILTIGIRIYRMAATNPVNSLRTE
jgi:putative ABC transport system permease protein